MWMLSLKRVYDLKFIIHIKHLYLFYVSFTWKSTCLYFQTKPEILNQFATDWWFYLQYFVGVVAFQTVLSLDPLQTSLFLGYLFQTSRLTLGITTQPEPDLIKINISTRKGSWFQKLLPSKHGKSVKKTIEKAHSKLKLN